MDDFHPMLQQASLQSTPHSPAQSAMQQQGFVAYPYNMGTEQRLQAGAASFSSLQMEYAKWAEAAADGDAAAGHETPRENAANANPETMKSQLQASQLEDTAQGFISRSINKLGFASSEQLRRHFARYGEANLQSTPQPPAQSAMQQQGS